MSLLLRRFLTRCIERSYSHHATQSLPRTQVSSSPPAKRPRRPPPPFSSPKPVKMTTRKPSRSSEPGPSTSSPRQSSFNAKRGPTFSKPSKKHSQPKPVLPGPYHNEAYIEKEHNRSPVPLKLYIKQTPKGSLNNFYQTVTGKLPTFTSVEGVIMRGSQRVQIHR